ncbi:hypothetical protein [Antarcticirhabdus aurantiaca]|uniref:Uncharacterized protein n=1 Tax=Antarcticirhabdus aurantiaca TaxID=2606717 RepID=A0ACD4NK35_9HYPH|nr:hypothetical protein [Antarcticirhabdus aurantiaca]WAJ27250.1 hypothetical protein OXU80_20700 [Jeongeuplla avenae]
MSALSTLDSRPNPLGFSLRRGAAGGWFVEGPSNCCGGIFVSREAALDFIKRERRSLEDLHHHVAFHPAPEDKPSPAAAAIRLVHG